MLGIRPYAYCDVNCHTLLHAQEESDCTGPIQGFRLRHKTSSYSTRIYCTLRPTINDSFSEVLSCVPYQSSRPVDHPLMTEDLALMMSQPGRVPAALRARSPHVTDSASLSFETDAGVTITAVLWTSHWP